MNDTQNTVGYIYFIKCGDFIKIGQSLDPEKRLMQMQTGNPCPLKLVKLLQCPIKDMAIYEQYFHKLFANKRHQGEWFLIKESDTHNLQLPNFTKPESERERIRREFAESLKEIKSQYNKEQKDKLKRKSRNELMSCNDWWHTDELDNDEYGYLMDFLESFGLTHRLKTCLENGYINFNETFDENGDLISCRTIEYRPEWDKPISLYTEYR